MQVPPLHVLEYLQQTPKSGPVEQLVVLLHGYGRDASLMKKLADEVQARLPQALILMPHAPEGYEDHSGDEGHAVRLPEQLRGDDPDDFEVGARRKWFSIKGATIEEVSRRVDNVTALVNDFISAHRDAHGLSDSNVALMGFSQGGVVALYSAYHRDTPIACVVGHSTIFMGGLGLKSNPATLYLYGLADEEFEPERYELSAALLKGYIPDATVQAVPDLRHTTNTESRSIVADYIAAHFR